MEYDDIIVGAGSAGSVLAARLTEDPSRSVLLLEAGPDFPTIAQLPAALLDPLQVAPAAFDWGYQASATPGRTELIAVPRGKVVGGSSAINGAMALRGMPADFDEWAAWGNDAWSWQRVLPYFRRLEDDPDEHDDIHGSGGPIPIQRPTPDRFIPHQRAFYDICRDLGFPEGHDLNAPGTSGICPWPSNVRDGMRISTALGYLLPARQRLNLSVRAECAVHRVLFSGTQANGVEVECGGEVQQACGRRITLAGGSFASPAILLRSGIGPAAELRAAGITPLVDLPAVGRNLIEHPQIGVNLLAAPGKLRLGDPMYQVALRFTSADSPERDDMQLYLFQFPESDTLRLSAVLQRLHSRGSLRLAGRDPHTPPRIDLNLADDAEDVRRLRTGMRLIWQVAQSPRLAPFLAGSVTLDDGSTLPLAQAVEALSTDAALDQYITRGVSQFYHPVGTARMGPATDANTVVDQHCLVRGVEGLRVVDASIMPNITRANTNLTCIMFGERVAEWMRAET